MDEDMEEPANGAVDGVSRESDNGPFFGSSCNTYEDEETLEQNHSEAEWAAFETRLRPTNLMIAFSIDEPTILVPEQGYWGFQELAPSITQVCGSKGVKFESGLQPIDGHMKVLLGRPVTMDRALWKFLRKGYVKVHGATIWVSPEFTGRRQSNLDLIEIEYSNANYLSAVDLHKVLKTWGAMEAIIVSHGASRLRHGKWPAIACISNAVTDPNTGEPKFAFRLCFECVSTANRVYQSYLERDNGPNQRVEDGRTIRLSPVRNSEWNPERQEMIRPSAAAEPENLNRRLHIFGVRLELSANQIKDRLASLGYPNMQVMLQPGRWWGTLTAEDEQSAARLFAKYGVQQQRRLFVGNIGLFVNKPGADGGLACFQCGLSGHFSRNCRRGNAVQQRFNVAEGHLGAGPVAYDRANSRWQSISRNALSQPDQGRTLALGPIGRRREVSGANQAEVYQRSLMQQYEPMMRALVAEQVREQSNEVVRHVQAELQRHTHEVDARLRAHDTAIDAVRSAQAATTTEMRGISSLLERMARHLKVPDFGEGGPAGGADSQ